MFWTHGYFVHATSKERAANTRLKINYWNPHKPVCFICSYVLSDTHQYKQVMSHDDTITRLLQIVTYEWLWRKDGAQRVQR